MANRNKKQKKAVVQRRYGKKAFLPLPKINEKESNSLAKIITNYIKKIPFFEKQLRLKELKETEQNLIVILKNFILQGENYFEKQLKEKENNIYFLLKNEKNEYKKYKFILNKKSEEASLFIKNDELFLNFNSKEYKITADNNGNIVINSLLTLTSREKGYNLTLRNTISGLLQDLEKIKETNKIIKKRGEIQKKIQFNDLDEQRYQKILTETGLDEDSILSEDGVKELIFEYQINRTFHYLKEKLVLNDELLKHLGKTMNAEGKIVNLNTNSYVNEEEIFDFFYKSVVSKKENQKKDSQLFSKEFESLKQLLMYAGIGDSITDNKKREVNLKMFFDVFKKAKITQELSLHFATDEEKKKIEIRESTSLTINAILKNGENEFSKKTFKLKMNEYFNRNYSDKEFYNKADFETFITDLGLNNIFPSEAKKNEFFTNIVNSGQEMPKHNTSKRRDENTTDKNKTLKKRKESILLDIQGLKQLIIENLSNNPKNNTKAYSDLIEQANSLLKQYKLKTMQSGIGNSPSPLERAEMGKKHHNFVVS